MEEKMEAIVLASASPRRTELLKQAGIPHVVRPGTFDESQVICEGSPVEYVKKQALFKAKSVADHLNSGLVLGVDTVVVFEDNIFGKPSNREEAQNMLSRLSNSTHEVISGLALINLSDNSSKTDYDVTKVNFAKLSPKDIEGYLNTGEWVDKAGAYAIQGIGSLLVEGIEGSYSNVVGLPLMKLRNMLEEYGINPLHVNASNN
jgi:septum formation protein